MFVKVVDKQKDESRPCVFEKVRVIPCVIVEKMIVVKVVLFL